MSYLNLNNFNNRGLVVNNFLLDTITGATFGGSLRKLSISYNGPAIRVRRSSDNEEADIGFNGVFLNINELLEFVGSSNGYVKILYNQINLELNAVAASTA